MPRRTKKAKQEAFRNQSPVSPLPSTPNLDFDALEDKIRGEESFLKDDLRKAKIERDLKKSRDDQEIERRLKKLREKLEYKKKP